jgi:hypothetical protein
MTPSLQKHATLITTLIKEFTETTTHTSTIPFSEATESTVCMVRHTEAPDLSQEVIDKHHRGVMEGYSKRGFLWHISNHRFFVESIRN